MTGGFARKVTSVNVKILMIKNVSLILAYFMLA
jgi:hypothetical protein